MSLTGLNSSSLVRIPHRDGWDRPGFMGQFSYMSICEDKDDTPGKPYDSRNEFTPTISQAIDNIISSPNNSGNQQPCPASKQLKLHVSDFELKYLENRITSELFSSSKKEREAHDVKDSGVPKIKHFDELDTLDTFHSSSEATQSLPKVKIYDFIFGDENCSMDSDLSLISNDSTTSSDKTVDDNTGSPSTRLKADAQPKKLRLGMFLDTKTVESNLAPLVDSLRNIVSQKEEAIARAAREAHRQSGQRRQKCANPGRFSLF